MVKLEHAGNRDIQVQSDVPGRPRRRAKDWYSRAGYPVRPASRRGGARPAQDRILLARVRPGFHRNPGRHYRTGRSFRALDRGAEMKLLLDTHIWIWALHSPERLDRAVRRQLERAENELHLSPVSIWEA